MSQNEVMKFLRATPAQLLLASALAISSAPAGEPAPISPPSHPEEPPWPEENAAGHERESTSLAPGWKAAPRPAPANPKELPPAFAKPTPDSIADLRSIQIRVKELVRRVTPAVVDVEIGGGTGSGVIITEDGLVLTAGHVCGESGRAVRMTFSDGRKAKGKTIGASHDSDCGLIRITDRGPWPHVAVGDLEQARVGDWVLALGHPGGFDPRRSLVVRLGRIIRLEDGNLQTDCTISPGDSGGPLLDMFGRVIGIHSAISSSLTANYHVPITDFFQTWNQMVKTLDKPPKED
jgi:serine protease Do